jgi:hypothetical protein
MNANKHNSDILISQRTHSLILTGDYPYQFGSMGREFGVPDNSGQCNRAPTSLDALITPHWRRF